MNRFLVIALLVLPLRLFSAEFDVWPLIGAEVESNGCVLALTLSTSPNLSGAAAVTNGNIFNGFGTNNTVTGTNKITLTLTSMGYDEAAAANRNSRTIYGTRIARLPYGLFNTNDIIAQNTTNVRVRVWLSDFVYQRDSNVVMTLLAGYFTTTNNASSLTNAVAVSSFTVTNSSQQAYPKVVGNWSYPGFRHETQAVVTLRGTFFNRFARNGRPVAAAVFKITDTDGTSLRDTQAVAQIDRAIGDAVAVQEYISRIDCTTLKSNVAHRADVTVYPLIGDSGSLLDTTDNVNSYPTPYYASITNLFDPRRSNAVVIACVDAVNGNDTTGIATNSANQGVIGSVSEKLPFLTIGRALQAIAATNNAFFGHNDYGGGIIYLTNGFHSYLGSSASVGNAPFACVTITRHPSVSRDNAVIQRLLTGSTTGGTRLKFYDIHICGTNGMVDNAASLKTMFWFDKCVINQSNTLTSAPLIQSSGASSSAHVYFTDCIISNSPAGLKPPGANSVSFSMFRGNDMLNYTNQVDTGYAVGNNCAITNTPSNANFFISESGSAGEWRKTNWVFAFNTFYALMSANSVNPLFFTMNNGAIESNYWGGAFVGNIIEAWNGTNGNALVNIAADSATGHVDNIILWNNVVTGQRCNLAYNDINTGTYSRYNWSILNNLFDDDNIKTDTFTGSGANGNRIGNWPVVFGVGQNGNWRGELVGSGSGGGAYVGIQGFLQEFVGMNSVWLAAVTNTIYQYVNPQAWNGNNGGFGQGGGSYRLKSTSPVFNFPTSWVLPFDIEGRTRSAVDPPGAHVAGNLKQAPIGF